MINLCLVICSKYLLDFQIRGRLLSKQKKFHVIKSSWLSRFMMCHLFLDDEICIHRISNWVLCTAAAAYDSECDNNATSWPHLARRDLPDFQLSWNFKIGPSVAIINSLWPCPWCLFTNFWSRAAKSARTWDPCLSSRHCQCFPQDRTNCQ